MSPRPPTTVQLRAFLGADDEGGYAFAEVLASPGAEPSGREVRVDAFGFEKASSPLPASDVDAAIARALAAPAGPVRVSEDVFRERSLQGYRRDAARALALKAAGGSRFELEPVAGAPAVLTVDGLDSNAPELAVRLRLAGGGHEMTLRRIPRVGDAWASELLVLPGGRRALLLVASVSGERKERYRLEALSEVELGAGLAALLDARAVEAIRRGEPQAAREDLARAIQAAPRDAVAHYNLACALALLGAENDALLALGRAVDLEPERLKAAALRDPDFDKLKDRVEFRLMVEPRLDDMDQ